MSQVWGQEKGPPSPAKRSRARAPPMDHLCRPCCIYCMPLLYAARGRRGWRQRGQVLAAALHPLVSSLLLLGLLRLLLQLLLQCWPRLLLLLLLQHGHIVA